MMHAYDKLYLEKARASLARMLDFAVYDLHQEITSFFGLFISSVVAQLFEQGDIHTLVGKSGVELAYEILERSGLPFQRVKPQYTMNERLRKAKPETNLKLLRQQNGLSQKGLAELSGVPLRTIQQYEQRQKSINKAQAEYLEMLSIALTFSL